MKELTPNPSTGFLESTGYEQSTFTSDRKVKFLQLAKEFVDQDKSPKISAICKAIGISIVTFYNHVNQDPEFKSQWDEILFSLEDTLSGALIENAKKANGVGAAAFWLKNRIPQRWSDNPGANNQSNLDIEWIKKLAQTMANVAKPQVIDAEIVNKEALTASKTCNIITVIGSE